MSQAYEFLKECGSFFVLTINGEPHHYEIVRFRA